jgi:hypothetical protein
MTVQDLLIFTVRKASRIISDHLEPGPRDSEQTLMRLIELLDRQDLASAIERLEAGQGLAWLNRGSLTWVAAALAMTAAH